QLLLPTDFSTKATTTQDEFAFNANEPILEFRNISFAYPAITTPSPTTTTTNEDVKQKIINNFSAKINRGEVVRIMGESGKGKSTIELLTANVLQPNSGEILMNGINIQNVPIRVLRKRLAICDQDHMLLSGDVLTNVKYGVMSSDNVDHVLEALDLAKA